MRADTTTYIYFTSALGIWYKFKCILSWLISCRSSIPLLTLSNRLIWSGAISFMIKPEHQSYGIIKHGLINYRVHSMTKSCIIKVEMLLMKNPIFRHRESPNIILSFLWLSNWWTPIHHPSKCSQNVTTLVKSSWLSSLLAGISYDPINLITHFHNSIHSPVL